MGGLKGDVGEVLGPHAQLPVICRTEAGPLVYCQGIDGGFMQLHYAQHRTGVAVDLHGLPCEAECGVGMDRRHCACVGSGSAKNSELYAGSLSCAV